MTLKICDGTLLLDVSGMCVGAFLGGGGGSGDCCFCSGIISSWTADPRLFFQDMDAEDRG